MEEHVKPKRFAWLKAKLKSLLYVIYFAFVFFIAFYWSFPVYVLKGFISEQLSGFLSQGSSGQGKAQVRIGDLGLWRLSGVAVRDVWIQFPQTGLIKGATWNLERLKMRIGLFSTLTGTPKLEFVTRLYEGDISGNVLLGQGQLAGLKLDIAGLNLGNLMGKGDKDSLAVQGKMDLYAYLRTGKSWSEDGVGEVQFQFAKLKVGPGPLSIPGILDNFVLPAVLLNDFSGSMKLDRGKAQIQNIQLKGGDLQAQMDLRIELATTLILSKVQGGGWFKLTDPFLKKNPAFASILELVPDLKNAKDANGRYGFKVDGSLLSPRPKFEKPKKT